MGANVISASRLSMLLGTCIVPAVLQNAGAMDALGVDRFYRSELYRLLGA